MRWISFYNIDNTFGRYTIYYLYIGEPRNSIILLSKKIPSNLDNTPGACRSLGLEVPDNKHTRCYLTYDDLKKELFFVDESL